MISYILIYVLLSGIFMNEICIIYVKVGKIRKVCTLILKG